MTLTLLDIANLLPITTIHGPNSIVPSALGKGEVFRRMKLKLFDLTNLLPIRMMEMPNMIIQSVLRTVQAL
jgi:hypothetical protein